MCNCKKREPIVQNRKPQTPEELHAQELNEWNDRLVEEFNTEEIDGNILVPTPMTYDWYNNIDEIEPIKSKEDE